MKAVEVHNLEDPQLVEFALVAPEAARVSLVGEFNGWNASATRRRPAVSSPDGVPRMVPLPPTAMMRMTPGRRVEIRGAWRGSTPKSPSAPGTTTMSTCCESKRRSGETSSNSTLSAAMIVKAP